MASNLLTRLDITLVLDADSPYALSERNPAVIVSSEMLLATAWVEPNEIKQLTHVTLLYDSIDALF